MFMFNDSNVFMQGLSFLRLSNYVCTESFSTPAKLQDHSALNKLHFSQAMTFLFL